MSAELDRECIQQMLGSQGKRQNHASVTAAEKDRRTSHIQKKSSHIGLFQSRRWHAWQNPKGGLHIQHQHNCLKNRMHTCILSRRLLEDS